MKEEAMEHGTKQDAEDMLQNMLDDALKAEKKARLEIMTELGIDKADE
jgi:hypothetical protein